MLSENNCSFGQNVTKASQSNLRVPKGDTDWQGISTWAKLANQHRAKTERDHKQNTLNFKLGTKPKTVGHFWSNRSPHSWLQICWGTQRLFTELKCPNDIFSLCFIYVRTLGLLFVFKYNNTWIKIQNTVYALKKHQQLNPSMPNYAKLLNPILPPAPCRAPTGTKMDSATLVDINWISVNQYKRDHVMFVCLQLQQFALCYRNIFM